MKATDGSQINFKKENVSCKKSVEYTDIFNIGWSGKRRNIDCTANGVRTFLTVSKTNFSETKLCKVINEQGKGINDRTVGGTKPNSFACAAATKFGKL